MAIGITLAFRTKKRSAGSLGAATKGETVDQANNNKSNRQTTTTTETSETLKVDVECDESNFIK